MQAPRRQRAPTAAQRQRDPARTQERILAAALEIFSAKGYAGGRVAEIAERAGVNKQLITYYFGGKEGLFRALGERWRKHEREHYSQGLTLADEVRRRVMETAAGAHGSKLLAWQGLTDDQQGDADAEARDARLLEEIAVVRERQLNREISADLDVPALILILLGAANALTVYPQIARGLFQVSDARDPTVVTRFADEIAKVISKLTT